MPPKKKRKGVVSGDRESSSSISFDRRRFWDATAAENYVNLLEKSMHRERRMDQSYPDCDTLILAREMHWGELVTPPADAVLSLVREFYTNLKVRHENHQVRIRGKMVAFDSWTINSMFSTPDYDVDDYTTFKGEPYPYNDVINTLCVPGTVWKLNNQRAPITFPATSLQKEAYNWYHFVASRIMPSGHVSDVTKSRAALVYCIITGKTVDVGKIIMYSILQAVRGTSTVRMPHSSTITYLCHRAGVTGDDSEQLLKTKGDIILYVPQTQHRRVGPNSRGRRSTQGEAASGSRAQMPLPLPPPSQPPPAASSSSRSSDDCIDALENIMRRQWLITREHMDYIHDFNEVLARRLPPSADPDDQFPSPPVWSHQPAEYDFWDDDDDVEDVDSES